MNSKARRASQAGLAILLFAALAGCSSGSQDLNPPPAPDDIRSLDSLPDGIGATDETPDAPPAPD